MAKQTFEKAMKELELIVQQLESGDQPLEEAVKKFEEGIKLSKFCSEKLDETEKRISILLKDKSGNLFEKPFISESELEDG
ncbi:MAG TPA: exodeoxyribonuclease VII small subunit [Bacteroidetes bacterium]|nr:MAG: exodeoxyribonuclease VII small subunit [Deltaproteobacteria bacterium]HHE65290.1 exodeoxyribonuclease VII small subunit [Bacteroidota bacterium]